MNLLIYTNIIFLLKNENITFFILAETIVGANFFAETLSLC